MVHKFAKALLVYVSVSRSYSAFGKRLSFLRNNLSQGNESEEVIETESRLLRVGDTHLHTQGSASLLIIFNREDNIPAIFHVLVA
jgi:hypothetical protein